MKSEFVFIFLFLNWSTILLCNYFGETCKILLKCVYICHISKIIFPHWLWLVHYISIWKFLPLLCCKYPNELHTTCFCFVKVATSFGDKLHKKSNHLSLFCVSFFPFTKLLATRSGGWIPINKSWARSSQFRQSL